MMNPVKKIFSKIMAVFRIKTGMLILIVPAIVAFGIFEIQTNLVPKNNFGHILFDKEDSVQPPKTKEIEYNPENFEDGDIIFRRGISLESRAIISLDEKFGYSHAGIIRKKGLKVEVIHASYGEEGQTTENIINEPIEKFLKPSSSSSSAVYRFDGKNKFLPLSAVSEAERLLDAEIPFDKDFDLTSADSLYCTELIWLAYKKAGIDLTNGKFDRVPSLFANPNKDYILPRSLLNSLQFHKVWESSK